LTRAAGVIAIDVGVLRGGWEGGFARTEPSATAPTEHVQAIERCVPGSAAGAIAPTGRAHGVGLGYESLEPDTQLASNMVVSVANGLVRDLVLITPAGPEVLTQSPY